MKTNKSLFLAVAAVIGATFFVGAKEGENDRPAGVDASQWIRISENAAIALTDEPAATRQLAGNFYVRTGKGWRVVSIVNPVAGQRLDDSAARRR